MYLKPYTYEKYISYKNKYFNLKKEYYQKGGNLNKEIGYANNKLGVNLFNKMDNNNIIFSPLSITFALALIHLAAKGNSNKELTYLFNHKYKLEELKQIYKIFNNDIIKITNVCLINKKKNINKEYLDAIKNLCLVSLDDFNEKNIIVNKINNYVKNNTNGLIKNVITNNDIDQSTLLILINTIYFKSEFLNKFNKNNTEKMLFKGNISKMVDTMKQINVFPYYENKDTQIIEMLYKDNLYAMGLILPKKNGIIPKLSINETLELINNLKKNEIELFLPKFKQRKNIKLIPILQKLGVKDIFDNNANLAGISKEMYVSNIIHEAIIIVDEIGTEATATTIIVGREITIISQSKPKLFQADHPFIYYIRHMPTNIFLFYGVLNNL